MVDPDGLARSDNYYGWAKIAYENLGFMFATGLMNNGARLENVQIRIGGPSPLHCTRSREQGEQGQASRHSKQATAEGARGGKKGPLLSLGRHHPRPLSSPPSLLALAHHSCGSAPPQLLKGRAAAGPRENDVAGCPAGNLTCMRRALGAYMSQRDMQQMVIKSIETEDISDQLGVPFQIFYGAQLPRAYACLPPSPPLPSPFCLLVCVPRSCGVSLLHQRSR